MTKIYNISVSLSFGFMLIFFVNVKVASADVCDNPIYDGFDGIALWNGWETPFDFTYYQSPTIACLSWRDFPKKVTSVGGWSFSHIEAQGNGYVCHWQTSQEPYADRTYHFNSGTAPVCVGVVTDAKKDNGCGGKENSAGNPCNVASGNKFQAEADFTTGLLRFSRFYNSSAAFVDTGFGRGWRHQYQQTLVIKNSSVTQISSTGRGEIWVRANVNGVWVLQGDADSHNILVESATFPFDYTLTKATGDIEKYSSTGLLVSEIDTNGNETRLTYSGDGKLNQITSHYGHSITLNYIDNHITSVIDSTGAVYNYEYSANDLLTTVVYPDTTQTDLSDNPRKVYHYEDTNYPLNLTGITDANGDRYATWSYDIDGKATSSEHAQTTNATGQERFELDYQGTN